MRCYGCRAEADDHPIRGIVANESRSVDRAEELLKSGDSEGAKRALAADTGEWGEIPLCEACWRDPQHRDEDRRRIKAHFFEAGAAADMGRRMAGFASLGMPRIMR